MGAEGEMSIDGWSEKELRDRLARLERIMGVDGFWRQGVTAARISADHAKVSRSLERLEQLRPKPGEPEDG